jgi:hypothetical protein
MVASNRKSVSPLARETAVPVATFKNSLRRWQARWKAEQSEPGATAVSRMTSELLLGVSHTQTRAR